MYSVQDSCAHLSSVFKWPTCLKYTAQPAKLMAQLFS